MEDSDSENWIGGAVDADVESKTAKSGDSLTLNTDITKQPTQPVLWYFNNILIAQINGEANTSCLYDGEGGRFRDRLEVDYESGSLTINNITTEHTGQYEAEIIRSQSTGTSHSLNRKPKCNSTKIIPKNNNMGDTIKTLFVSVSDSGLSPGAVAGIWVAVLLIVAAVGFVISCRQKNIYKRAANEKQNEDV